MTKGEQKKPRKNKQRISQADVPAYSIEHALRVPLAIVENYAGEPTKPIDVAAAMDLLPTSSQFRMITGSAMAYGLTEGGAQSQEISITKLALQILQPLEEAQDVYAQRQAILKPRVIGEFLTKYDGSQIPKSQIAQNVLSSMGVPADRALDVLAMIIDGAEALGLITEIKGKKYVNLSPVIMPSSLTPASIEDTQCEVELVDAISQKKSAGVKGDQLSGSVVINNRVFINNYMDNMSFLEPITKLLSFGGMEAVVPVGRAAESGSDPGQVIRQMCDCGAAIIRVDQAQTVLGKDTKGQCLLDANLLMEIGAAIALYGSRFILLVSNSVQLPVNLQGLYEVRYAGDCLDGETTLQLLDAINAMRTEQSMVSFPDLIVTDTGHQ